MDIDDTGETTNITSLNVDVLKRVIKHHLWQLTCPVGTCFMLLLPETIPLDMS